MHSHVEVTQVAGTARTVAASHGAAEQAQARLIFIDNLRVLLTILVIMQHLAVSYGGAGSWYYQEHTDDLLTAIVLTLFTATNQAFFMGCFFFIAAYFTPAAYDRKGACAFLRDRLLRLGIPLLVYDLVLNPVVEYLAAGLPGGYGRFWGAYVGNLTGIGHGPLWFVETLLIFTGLYTLWRLTIAARVPLHPLTPSRPPATATIILYILALATASFVVRQWVPIDWVFEPLNLQFPFFAQYISLFIIGLVAARRNWFLTISDAAGRRWLGLGVMGVPLFLVLELLGDAQAHFDWFKGGARWQAFAGALWEASVCVGMIIGLIVLFRRRCREQGPLARALSASAYTAYLIHPLIIVGVAYAGRIITIHPLLKFGLAVLVAVPLCFGISDAIRRLPVVRRIL